MTDTPETPEALEISAEKESWVVGTRASDDREFAKDIPWAAGDKVLLLSSDQSFEGCTTETDQPMQGLIGDFYGDTSPFPCEITF